MKALNPLALGLSALFLLAAHGLMAQTSAQPGPVKGPKMASDPNGTQGPIVTYRRGPVEVVPLSGAAEKLEGWADSTGRRAYGIVVPPGGKVTLRLRHAKAAYFQVKGIVTHNLGYKPDPCLSGEPKDCFNNATEHPVDVYFVVTDSGHWADPKAPYTLEITRSWKPGTEAPALKLRKHLTI